MFIHTRTDYTQRLFDQFMANINIKPYAYICNGLTILTTEPKLLNQLKTLDNKNLSGCCTYVFEKHINLSKDCILENNVKNAILFVSEEKLSEINNIELGTSTCIFANSLVPTERLLRLIPTVVNYHTNKYEINSKQDKRVPYLQVKASHDNFPVHFSNNGLYLNSHQFDGLSNKLINDLSHHQAKLK